MTQSSDASRRGAAGEPPVRLADAPAPAASLPRLPPTANVAGVNVTSTNAGSAADGDPFATRSAVARLPRRSRPSRVSTASMLPAAPVEGVGRIALVVVVCVLAIAGLFAVRSLVAPLLLGACVAAMVRPAMNRIRRRVHGPKKAAAAATASVVLLLALPLAAITIPVAAEVRELVALVRAGKLEGLPLLFSFGPTSSTGAAPRSAGEFLHAFVPRVADALPGMLGTASEIAIGIFVFLMTLYYVLVDGESAMRLARRVSPLANAHLDALIREFVEVGRGVLVSVGLTALVEGGCAGVAYFAIGLPSAALLTLLTFLAALVPIGTILVWGPVAAVLFAQGRSIAGAVIVFTGLIVISGIDHFVRPQLTRLARTRLHPLLVFLGMFGGMASLGGWGLFAGPMLIALGVAALRLYDRDQQARVRDATLGALRAASAPLNAPLNAPVSAPGSPALETVTSESDPRL